MEIKLNLIPPSKKEEIRKNKRLRTTIKAEVVLTALLLGFFIVLLSFRYILDVGLSGEVILNSEIEKADQFEKIKDYNNQFNEANDQIKQIALIDQSQLYWSKVFMKISQIIPSGIKVDSLETENYTVTLSGTADIRGDLIDFKGKLEDEGCFSDVDLPLSNLVDKADAEFKIVFKVKESCLRKQSPADK